jgi:hypothetical protein
VGRRDDLRTGWVNVAQHPVVPTDFEYLDANLARRLAH